MRKKVLDQSLHSTRGNKNHIKYGLSSRVVSGEGFSKKANMKYRYINYNKEGTTNRMEWFSKT